MDIHLTEAFIKYRQEKNFNAITVSFVKSGASCSAVQVAKVETGLPREDTLNNYSIFIADGITFYITKNIKLSNSITFDHARMLGKDMIEMHGYQVIK